jgi:hypothetical protein
MSFDADERTDAGKSEKPLPAAASPHGSFQFGLRGLFALTSAVAAMAAVASRNHLSSSLFAAGGFSMAGSVVAIVQKRPRLAFWLSYVAVLALFAAMLLLLVEATGWR